MSNMILLVMVAGELHMLRFGMIATLLALAAPAFAEPADLVSIKDSALFDATLRKMGYNVRSSETPSGAPQFTTNVGELETSVLLLGCTKGKNCSHLMIYSSYSDVVNAPDRWITEMNDNFDFLKVGKRDDKSLFFSASHFVEGMPISTLKIIFETWEGDTASLADKAREAKLVKE